MDFSADVSGYDSKQLYANAGRSTETKVIVSKITATAAQFLRDTVYAQRGGKQQQ